MRRWARLASALAGRWESRLAREARLRSAATQRAVATWRSFKRRLLSRGPLRGWQRLLWRLLPRRPA